MTHIDSNTCIFRLNISHQGGTEPKGIYITGGSQRVGRINHLSPSVPIISIDRRSIIVIRANFTELYNIVRE